MSCLHEQLPSKQGQRKRQRLETFAADLAATQNVIAKETALSAQLAAERKESTDRTNNLKRVTKLRLLQNELKEKLKHYEDRDPTVLKQLGVQISFAMEHACRWGANLAAIRCSEDVLSLCP